MMLELQTPPLPLPLKGGECLRNPVWAGVKRGVPTENPQGRKGGECLRKTHKGREGSAYGKPTREGGRRVPTVRRRKKTVTTQHPYNKVGLWPQNLTKSMLKSIKMQKDERFYMRF